MRLLTCAMVLLVAVGGAAVQADIVTIGVLDRPDTWPEGTPPETSARFTPSIDGRFHWMPVWVENTTQAKGVNLTATVQYAIAPQGVTDATADWSGFGTLEGVAAKPLAPTTLDLGAGVGLQLTTLPAGWLAVGGRKVFANALLLTTGDLAWGGSISLQSAAQDDGFRLGLCWNSEDGVQAFLGKSFSFAW